MRVLLVKIEKRSISSVLYIRESETNFVLISVQLSVGLSVTYALFAFKENPNRWG